ncbi:MAG: hypothetical protein ACPLW5_01235 [Candidatus Bathyarchaeales archaeon]
MISNSNPTTFLTLMAGIEAFIFIMLLSALVETKERKDAEPRIIIENFKQIQEMKKKTLLSNMEEEHKFDQATIRKVAETLRFLYNLET